MRKRMRKGDVHWFLPNRKRPIAYSTKCTSDFICLINNNNTPNELLDKIKNNGYLVSDDAYDVLNAYIEKGYGDKVLYTRM